MRREFAFAATIVAALALSGCAGMSDLVRERGLERIVEGALEAAKVVEDTRCLVRPIAVVEALIAERGEAWGRAYFIQCKLKNIEGSLRAE